MILNPSNDTMVRSEIVTTNRRHRLLAAMRCILLDIRQVFLHKFLGHFYFRQSITCTTNKFLLQTNFLYKRFSGMYGRALTSKGIYLNISSSNFGLLIAVKLISKTSSFRTQLSSSGSSWFLCIFVRSSFRLCSDLRISVPQKSTKQFYLSIL